jgi:hypothetical protein
MRHRDISKKIRDFLWKHAHGIYRLGPFWNNTNGYEERGTCPLCKQTETFQHIMQECTSKEREIVWKAANELWKIQYPDDLPTTEGTVPGCGLANFTKENRKPDAAKNRLYKIPISESARLIWVLRCERRIRNDNDYDHLERPVRDKWYKKINDSMGDWSRGIAGISLGVTKHALQSFARIVPVWRSFKIAEGSMLLLADMFDMNRVRYDCSDLVGRFNARAALLSRGYIDSSNE